MFSLAPFLFGLPAEFLSFDFLFVYPAYYLNVSFFLVDLLAVLFTVDFWKVLFVIDKIQISEQFKLRAGLCI
jgi:hypothetical protein